MVKLYAAGTPDEQGDAEFRFQGADLLAERRLLHVEPPRRAGDVPFLGNRDEIAEMAQVHGQFIL